jgi:hypothetical protein
VNAPAGPLLFLLAGGTVLAIVLMLATGGLVIGGRQRQRALELAKSLGWTYRGAGEFTGTVGDSQWRGGACSDPEAAGYWTEFVAGVPGLEGGGFHIGLRSVVDARRTRADPGSEALSWREIPAGSAAWREQHKLVASDSRWAALIDAEFESRWFAVTGSVEAHAHENQLRVRREDGATEASLDASVALLRVGEVLLKGACVLARGH